MSQDQPEVQVRKRREHEYFLAHFVVVAPTRPDIHDRRLKFYPKLPDWEPGRWNYSEEEYARLEKAKEGYVYYAGCRTDEEPDQAVFDAVCDQLRRDHREYLRWHEKRAERSRRANDPIPWPAPYPLELPKGTAWLDMDLDDPDHVSHWVTTDRTPSTDR
jgi:hypothetical protein